LNTPLTPNFHYICGVDSMVSGMNFVHHISNGFRCFGGGYSSSITHTMAHELGLGIFGLDHIFSGAYGIKKGATYNLMDYTEKTPNDALSYHEWTQINLPLPSWSALSRVEEDMWLKSPILTRKLMRDICLSYKNKEIVNQSNKYIVPEKECRITKYKQNGYEFIYFYKSKEEAEKYLNDNNELNDKTYALNVIEDQKGTTQKIDAMLSSNLKTCPNVFDEDDDEDFILELLRKIKLANKFGEDLTLPFGSAEKDASEITLPNGSIITDVEVVVNKNSVSLKAVKTEHEWEIGFSDSVFCFGVSDETEQYPLQISCNATDATALRKYLGLKVSDFEKGEELVGHYVVSDELAYIRDRNTFQIVADRSVIPIGTEVVVISEANGISLVRDVVSRDEHYTSSSNLTEITYFDTILPLNSCAVYARNPYKLYRLDIPIEESLPTCTIDAKCGKYYRVINSTFDEIDIESEFSFEGCWIDTGYFYIDTTLCDEIIIYVNRTNQGEYTTTGTLRTHDGKVVGYTTELSRGSDEECKTPCNDGSIPYDQCNCIVEGMYLIAVNDKNYGLTKAGKLKCKNNSIRITSTIPNSRSGVLLHSGQDDAAGWSQGCIILLPNTPTLDLKYEDRKRRGRNNTQDESMAFSIKLQNWLRERIRENPNAKRRVIITREY
ncbi:MAG: hypothetical protein U0L67_08555, partial [Paludibacteraceae bacterium]|nr:hypothetical protein [Paludibacteraceae bacterium]